MDFIEYRRHDATALAELVRKREVRPSELLKLALDRAQAVQPDLRPLSLLEEGFARAEIARGLPAGPFTGVPFLLKDLFAFLPGTRLTNGSRLFESFDCPFESTHVARLRAAGLVVFGKTASPEFGVNVTTEPKRHGPTRNPWDPTRSAGGSSGGAAVAVASGILPMAHGSDGGGSIRIPASACGLVGLKPSRARNPIGPMVGEGWNGLVAGHVLSRSVRDSAIALDATAGPEPGDPYACPSIAGSFAGAAERDPPRLRIGLLTSLAGGAPVEAACVEAAEEAGRKLEALGHAVEPLTLALEAEDLGRTMGTIVAVNLARDLDGWAEALGRPLERSTVEACTLSLAERGRRLGATAYGAAIAALHQMSRELGRVFGGLDLILSPTLGTLPPPLGLLDQDMDDLDRFLGLNATFIPFTPLYNMTGCPAISLPLEQSATGMPVGIMLGAALGREDVLLAVGGQLERAHPWLDHVPPEPAPQARVLP